MTENISTLLSQVATIAVVRCSAPGLKRLDKDASRKAERDHGAIHGSTNLTVSRLAGAEAKVKYITDHHTAARALLIENTTAWGDRRLLPNTRLEKFMGPWGKLKGDHDKAVEDFLAEAPMLIAEAEHNKGDFNVKVPTLSELQHAFAMTFALEPVPDVSTYRSGNLDKALEKVLKERFEANIKAAYTEAQVDAVKRIAKPLENMITQLSKYEKNETNRIYDSLVGNVQEIAEVFGEWNLTNDPMMKRLDDALSAFGGIEADDLKTSPELRKDVTSRAAKILEEIKAGGYL
jgi:hypothetical protein